MRVLELFSGIGVLSATFREHGHEPAPRGSKSGTQRINGKLARAKLSRELCEHIVAICEELG